MKNLMVAFLMLASPAMAKDYDPKVTVWVEAQTDEDGWEIKDFEDSAKDLSKKIKGKFWEKAESRESADVVLTVVNRYQEGTGTMSTTYNTITGWSASEEKGREVEVLMTLRNGKQRIFKSNGIALVWQKAADDTKKHIEKYLKENYDRVISLRPGK